MSPRYWGRGHRAVRRLDLWLANRRPVAQRLGADSAVDASVGGVGPHSRRFVAPLLGHRPRSVEFAAELDAAVPEALDELVPTEVDDVTGEGLWSELRALDWVAQPAAPSLGAARTRSEAQPSAAPAHARTPDAGAHGEAAPRNDAFVAHVHEPVAGPSAPIAPLTAIAPRAATSAARSIESVQPSADPAPLLVASVAKTFESTPHATGSVQTSTEFVPSGAESAARATEPAPSAAESVQPSADPAPLPVTSVAPRDTESIQTSTEFVSSAAESVQTSIESALPAATPEATPFEPTPRATESVQTSTESVPTGAEAAPRVTESAPRAAEAAARAAESAQRSIDSTPPAAPSGATPFEPAPRAAESVPNLVESAPRAVELVATQPARTGHPPESKAAYSPILHPTVPANPSAPPTPVQRQEASRDSTAIRAPEPPLVAGGRVVSEVRRATLPRDLALQLAQQAAAAEAAARAAVEAEAEAAANAGPPEPQRSPFEWAALLGLLSNPDALVELNPAPAPEAEGAQSTVEAPHAPRRAPVQSVEHSTRQAPEPPAVSLPTQELAAPSTVESHVAPWTERAAQHVPQRPVRHVPARPELVMPEHLAQPRAERAGPPTTKHAAPQMPVRPTPHLTERPTQHTSERVASQPPERATRHLPEHAAQPVPERLMQDLPLPPAPQLPRRSATQHTPQLTVAHVAEPPPAAAADRPPAPVAAHHPSASDPPVVAPPPQPVRGPQPVDRTTSSPASAAQRHRVMPAPLQRQIETALPSPEPGHRPKQRTPDPLPETTRRFLEPLVGIDPGTVRTFGGADASRTATAQRADALSVDQDVLLGGGRAPSSQAPADLGLLAHELTHVARRREAQFVPPVAALTVHPTPGVQEPAATPPVDEEALARDVEVRVTRAATSLGENPLSHEPPPHKPLEVGPPRQPIEVTPRRQPSEVMPPPQPIEVAAPHQIPPHQARPVWNGLPAPWEPLPDWLTQPDSAPPARPSAAVTTNEPAFSHHSETSPRIGESPAVALAAQGRALAEPVASDDAPAATAAAAAAGQPAGSVDPDLDALAKQVYGLLKRRLAVERRLRI